MAAQILRIVNSPMYYLRREVNSLEHAVANLGIQGIRMLALGFGLSRSSFTSGPRNQATGHLRRRSVIASAVARELASMLAPDKREEVFLAALMQDLGIAALLEVEGETYADLMDLACSDHALLPSEEKRLLETDHTEVGAWLLEQWGLPPVLRQMVARSHSATYDVSDPAELCVGLSGDLSDVLIVPEHSDRLLERTTRSAETLGVDPCRIERVMEKTAREVPEILKLYDLDAGVDDYESTFLRAQQAALSVGLHEMAQVRTRAVVLEELSGRVDRLTLEARTDRVTGVYNRRFVEETVESAFREAVTNDVTHAICFCDLDNFKSINDRLGHATGDQVLRAVATSLREALREGDFVGRYGGDEFLILLRGCASEMVMAVAQRFQVIGARGLERIPLHSEISCAISVGFAVQAGRGPFAKASEWVEAADAALYQAKRSGKSRVVGHQYTESQRRNDLTICDRRR